MIQFIVIYFFSQITAMMIVSPVSKTALQFWLKLAIVQLSIMGSIYYVLA